MERIVKYWKQLLLFCGQKWTKLCLCEEFTTIHLLLLRYSEFHDDTRFTMSIRELFGILCKYLHTKRHYRTYENLLFYRFADDWQTVYFSSLFELISHQTSALHFHFTLKLSENFSLNWCGIKNVLRNELIKATRNLRLQTIARNWSRVGVRSWKHFCSLCVL
jgi:hypothetical protein